MVCTNQVFSSQLTEGSCQMERPDYSNMFKTPNTLATLAELSCKPFKQVILTVKTSLSIGTLADQRDNDAPEKLSFYSNVDMLILSWSQRDAVLRGT